MEKKPSFRSCHLLLASGSPRRRELLDQIGVRYRVVEVNIPETPQPEEKPEEYAIRLAESKARAGADVEASCPALGADTIVVINNTILEKPRDRKHAADMLARLSGGTHQVMTAVSVCHGERCKTLLNITEVDFRSISSEEIEQYWQTGEPRDKAGAYGIQGLAGVFVSQIRGSYSSVVGLPLYETQLLLREFSVPVWAAEQQ